MTILDAARTEASTIKYGQILLNLLLRLPWLLGWTLGKTAIGLQWALYAIGWLAGQTFTMCQYAGAAVKLGWQDARRANQAGGR